MSESETPTTPAAGEPPTAPAPAQSSDSSASAAANFDDLRRKLREQFSGLGEQVDAMQSKLAADLAQATAQARAVIEKEIATVKDQYPDAFSRLHELRDVGEEGWGVLRTRLDRLAGDLEKALGGFVNAVGDAVKNSTGQGHSDAAPASPSPAAPDAASSPAAEPSEKDAAAAPATDKPAASS